MRESDLEDIEYLAVIDADNIDNDLWFGSWYTNGIFKLNIYERKIEFIDYFCVDKFKNKNIRHVRSYHNEIYFADMFSYKSEYNGIVNFDTKSMKQKGCWKFINEKYIYQDIIVIGKRFIIMPCDITHPLIVFDLETKKSREVCNWIEKYNIEEKQYGKMINVGEYFYASFFRTNQLLRVNGRTLKADIITIDDLLFPLNRLIFDGKGVSFYATGFNVDQFLEWQNGRIKYITLPQKNYRVGRGAVCCNKLYLFPEESLHDIVVYHTEKKELYTLPLPENINIIPSRLDVPFFGAIKVMYNMVISLPWGVDGFLIIDAKKDTVNYVSSRIDTDLAKRSYYKSVDLNEMITESDEFLLDDYLHCIECVDR